MKLKIFFSWQLTTDKKYNKNFILSCIDKAVKKISTKPELKGVEFEILEGSTGESGSPPVATKIIDERIPNSNIFIADLSVVNYIGGLKQFVRRIIGDKFKPFQNNNVILEHGVATNAIGLDKMIGVLNNTFGSPNANPENIPFDLRHIRFPIEYNYTPNTKDKDAVQKQLIDDLAIAIKATAITALESQKSKFYPLLVWSDWQNSISTVEKFVPNPKFDEIKNLIISTEDNPNQTTRILGLSGLGKTRMLFEIFRSNPLDSNSILLSSRVLYLNCNLHPNTNFYTIISNAIIEQKNPIIILDNCDINLHRQLIGLVHKKDNRTTLISLDSNPEESETSIIRGVNYIVLKKEDLNTVVEKILDNRFNNLDEDSKRKIKEFSQGIPLMAVLLAESVKNGEEFIGKLDDKEILDKLLGQKGKDQESRSILRSCSMFDFFGFEDDVSLQYKFIAANQNITISNNTEHVRISNFLDVINHYKKREIFEKQGRFLGIRPFPLAMALAVEWLDICTSERLLQVINDISNLNQPHNKQLINSLAERMKYLGYNDKAVGIVEKLAAIGGPFHNAEVLNTELGSRLFRSFVEVNPVVISQTLKEIFLNKSEAEILEIVNGRRNLVSVLEKLCFDKRTFRDSSKVLLKFAISENESWANNATGQFLHLFNIHLSGTEADLKARWEIIEWMLSTGEHSYIKFGLEAMKVGLNFGHVTRMSGAERQGSKQLFDYNPTWKEIYEYWNNILTKLLEITASNNELSNLASETIAKSIRTMFHVNMGDLIIPFIKHVSELRNNDWDSGLSGLKLARKYEKQSISEKQLDELNILIKNLTKTDFASRYISLVKSRHLAHDRSSYSSEDVLNGVISLADEFVTTNISWETTLLVLYRNQLSFSYQFGKRLSEILSGNLSKLKLFIDTSLKVLLEIPEEEREFTILASLIANSDDEIKKEFYSNLYKSDSFKCQLFYFLSLDKSGKNYFEFLFQLVDKRYCDLNNFHKLNYSNSLFQLNQDELKSLSERLFGYGNEGFVIVFDIFSDLIHADPSKKEFLMPIVKRTILHLGFKRDFLNVLDVYKWAQTITELVKDKEEVDFAKFINRSIIESIDWDNLYHLDNDVQHIYEVLIGVHFDAIWDELSEGLLKTEEEYSKFYGLKNILGSRIGGSGRTIGILFNGNIESIFTWCHNNKPLAPARIAELAPIFNYNEGKYEKWHPFALKLIDEFGDVPEVISYLSSNMGTFSWVGSIVPYLEAKKDLFNQLIEHKYDEIREWANQNIKLLEKEIDRERNRDEERFL